MLKKKTKHWYVLSNEEDYSMEIKKIKLWENVIPYFDEENDTPNSMSAYFTQTWKKVPAVVILPGGGYRGRSVHEGDDIARFYESCGFHAFVVDYRLAPNKFPAPMADAQRAIKIIRKNADDWAVDENRIFVVGFSAGGHLASSVVTMEDFSKIGDEYDDINCKPTGAILCYAVTSAMDEDGRVVECVQNMFDSSIEPCEKYTTYKLVDEKTCPCFLWHTSEDECVDVIQSLKFAAALAKNKIPYEMHIYPHGPHGLGLAKVWTDIRNWAQQSVDWILKNF